MSTDRELLRECLELIEALEADYNVRADAKFKKEIRAALAAPEHAAPLDSTQEYYDDMSAPTSVSPQAPTAERDYCEACGYTDSHDPNCPRPKGEEVRGCLFCLVKS